MLDADGSRFQVFRIWSEIEIIFNVCRYTFVALALVLFCGGRLDSFETGTLLAHGFWDQINDLVGGLPQFPISAFDGPIIERLPDFLSVHSKAQMQNTFAEVCVLRKFVHVNFLLPLGIAGTSSSAIVCSQPVVPMSPTGNFRVHNYHRYRSGLWSAPGWACLPCPDRRPRNPASIPGRQ